MRLAMMCFAWPFTEAFVLIPVVVEISFKNPINVPKFILKLKINWQHVLVFVAIACKRRFQHFKTFYTFLKSGNVIGLP